MSKRSWGREAIESLILGDPEVDPRASAARLGSTLMISAGLLGFATQWFIPNEEIRRAPALIAVAALILGGIAALRLPWGRWHPQAIVGQAIFVLACLALLNYAIVGILGPYRVIYTLVFGFAGLTLPRRTTYLLLLPAVASYLGPELANRERRLVLVGAAVAVPIWILLAEVLGRSLVRIQRAEQGTQRLMDATRNLSSLATEQEAADAIARMATDLLEADAAVVLVNSEQRDRSMINQGQVSFAIPINEASVKVGANSSAAKSLRRGDFVMVEHGERSTIVDEVLRDNLGADSMMYVPLRGEGSSFGLLAVGWRSRRGPVSQFGTRAIRLLTREAAQTLERLRAARRLTEQAETDELTGLSNRRTYSRVLHELEQGDAVVLVDLDHFKSVNDRFGHVIGDNVLRSLAACMKDVARAGDCVARYGGEEFAMVLTGAGHAGARSALERMQSSWNATTPVTTFSAGIAVHDRGEIPAATLARADEALYAAKANGRDRIEEAGRVAERA